MAEFNTKCPHCNVELVADEDWIGMEVECPTCKQTFIVAKETPKPPKLSLPQINSISSDKGEMKLKKQITLEGDLEETIELDENEQNSTLSEENTLNVKLNHLKGICTKFINKIYKKYLQNISKSYILIGSTLFFIIVFSIFFLLSTNEEENIIDPANFRKKIPYTWDMTATEIERISDKSGTWNEKNHIYSRTYAFNKLTYRFIYDYWRGIPQELIGIQYQPYNDIEFDVLHKRVKKNSFRRGSIVDKIHDKDEHRNPIYKINGTYILFEYKYKNIILYPANKKDYEKKLLSFVLENFYYYKL